MAENYDPYGMPFVASASTDLPEEAEGEENKKDEKLGSKRGIETLFRTQYPMHVDLSALADSKSNIMISINGLMVSILLASISPKIETNPWLLLPTTVLLIGCIISLIYAVLAAMPRVTQGQMTLEEVRRRDVNILFFGNYTRMARHDYIEAMTDLLHDKNKLYRRMMEDIYNLGGVLQRKFLLLRISYFAFMAGLLAAVLLYIMVFVFVTSVSPV
jgi:hypothetical protein